MATRRTALTAALLIVTLAPTQAQDLDLGKPTISDYAAWLERKLNTPRTPPAPGEVRIETFRLDEPTAPEPPTEEMRRGLTNALEGAETNGEYRLELDPPTRPRIPRLPAADAARKAARRLGHTELGRGYLEFLYREVQDPDRTEDQRLVLNLTLHNILHGLRTRSLSLAVVGQLVARVTALPAVPAPPRRNGFEFHDYLKELRWLEERLAWEESINPKTIECARCHPTQRRFGPIEWGIKPTELETWFYDAQGFAADLVDAGDLAVITGVAEVGGGFVPVVGEVQDVLVIVDPEARWWERGVAVVSLGGNAVTAGVLPNFGGVMKGGGKLTDAAIDGGRLVDDVVEAVEPKRIYSIHQLTRRLEDGRFHDFPTSFDDVIFAQGSKRRTKGYYNQPKEGYSDDTILYTMRGQANDHTGTYEIGVRPSLSGKTELVMHRVFRPDRKPKSAN